MIKLSIPIAPVTKKNSQRIVKSGDGRYYIRPSEAFEAYQKAASGLYLSRIIRSYDGSRVKFDKENPRVEIEIEIEEVNV